MGIIDLFNLHFSIPSILVILIVAILLYKFFLNKLFRIIWKWCKGTYNPTALPSTVIAGVLSGLIASIIFVTLGHYLLGWGYRTKLTGTYNAYILENGKEVEWGKVKILYSPWSGSSFDHPVELSLKYDDIIMSGKGAIINNRYLIGHYSETGRLERRRSGTFFYVLSGDGQTWRGTYIAIDIDNAKPLSGQAVWKRAR